MIFYSLLFLSWELERGKLNCWVGSKEFSRCTGCGGGGRDCGGGGGRGFEFEEARTWSNPEELGSFSFWSRGGREVVVGFAFGEQAFC